MPCPLIQCCQIDIFFLPSCSCKISIFPTSSYLLQNQFFSSYKTSPNFSGLVFLLMMLNELFCLFLFFRSNYCQNSGYHCTLQTIIRRHLSQEQASPCAKRPLACTAATSFEVLFGVCCDVLNYYRKLTYVIPNKHPLSHNPLPWAPSFGTRFILLDYKKMSLPACATWTRDISINPPFETRFCLRHTKR